MFPNSHISLPELIISAFPKPKILSWSLLIEIEVIALFNDEDQPCDLGFFSLVSANEKLEQTLEMENGGDKRVDQAEFFVIFDLLRSGSDATSLSGNSVIT